MKRTSIPRRRYGTDDYPLMEESAIGRVIPVGYGTYTALLPTQINTYTRRYKVMDQAIVSLVIRDSETSEELAEGTDYYEFLATAEFRLSLNCRLVEGETYYFAINADYTINGTNYIQIGQNYDQYVDGVSYTINGSAAWAPTINALRFQIWGRPAAGEAESSIASNTVDDEETGPLNLRDTTSSTRVGQAFIPSESYLLSKIHFYGISQTVTPPTGNIWVTVYEAINSEVEIGIPSEEKTVAQISVGEIEMAFVGGDEDPPELECDIVTHSPAIDQVADILPDVIENILGKNPAILDATELANLATDRTEPLEVFFNEEIEFGDFVGKLEAGQIWKLVPLQDATYGTVVYEAGEPGNTPHFRDYDFLSFRMEWNIEALRQTFNVFYAEDPIIGDYSAVQKASDVARFFYMNEQSMDVETYLRDLADADALAEAYRALYEVPILTVTFEVHGWALDLLPGRDKVKLTRERAAYAGGSLAGVLFRIVKLVKKPESNRVEITAAVWANSPT